MGTLILKAMKKGYKPIFKKNIKTTLQYYNKNYNKYIDTTINMTNKFKTNFPNVEVNEISQRYITQQNIND